MTNHLSRDQLLLYLDGELSSSDMRKAAAHLQACWTCQVELGRLKEHIAVIFDAQAELLGPSPPSPPKPWPRVESRIEKARESHRPFWRKLFTPRSRLSLAYGTSALALLILGMLVWAPVVPVSAKEVLNNAILAGNGRQAITLRQVVRQRVRITKTVAGGNARTAALNSWKSAKSSYWNAGPDSVNTELLARYQANGLASALPLSPAAIESWAKVAGSEPSALSEGRHVAVQVLANSAGQSRGLRAVSFHVQTGDWHMDQMTLSFVDATFQISEEESTILDRKEVPKEILAALKLDVDSSPPSLPAASVSGSREAEVLTGKTTPVNLDDLEMDVRSALHLMGADLGESIEIVVRPPNRLLIKAAGVSPKRKEQLTTLWGNKQAVRLDFEEPATDAVPRRTAAKTMAIQDADQARQTNLSQYFNSPAAQENYARTVLKTSTGILAHLYALRELASRWPPASEGRLSTDSKAKLIVMLRDHATELRTGTTTLKQDLQLILRGEPANGQPTVTGSSNWQDASSSGLDAASTIDRTLRALLTMSDAPLSLDQALSKLHQASRDLELALNELAQSLK